MNAPSHAALLALSFVTCLARAQAQEPLPAADVLAFLHLEPGVTSTMRGVIKSLSTSGWHAGTVIRSIDAAEVTIDGKRYLREVTRFEMLPGLAEQERLLRVASDGVYVYDRATKLEVRWLPLPLPRGTEWNVVIGSLTSRWSATPDLVDSAQKDQYDGPRTFTGCLELVEAGPDGSGKHVYTRDYGWVGSVLMLPTGQDFTIQFRRFIPAPGATAIGGISRPGGPPIGPPAGGQPAGGQPAGGEPAGGQPAGGAAPVIATPESRAEELCRRFAALHTAQVTEHFFAIKRGNRAVGLATMTLTKKGSRYELDGLELVEGGNSTVGLTYEATVGPALEVEKSSEMRRSGRGKSLDGPFQAFEWDLGPPRGKTFMYVWKDVATGRRAVIEELTFAARGVPPFGPEHVPALLLAMQPDVDYTFQTLSGEGKRLVPLTYRKAASSETRRIGDRELELTDVVVARGEGRRAERVTLRIAPDTGEVMWKDVGKLEYVRITAEEARAQQR